MSKEMKMPIICNAIHPIGYVYMLAVVGSMIALAGSIRGKVTAGDGRNITASAAYRILSDLISSMEPMQKTYIEYAEQEPNLGMRLSCKLVYNV